VVRLQDHDDTRSELVETRPDVPGMRRWGERIEQKRDSPRLDREGRDLGLPVEALAPGRMRLAPQPQPRRDISDFDGHRPPSIAVGSAAPRRSATMPLELTKELR